MDVFKEFLNAINTVLDIIIPILCGLALFELAVNYTIRKLKEDKKKGTFGRGVFLGTIAFAEVAALVACIWFFPEKLSSATHGTVDAHVFRWLLLYLTLVPLVFIITNKHSGLRGTFAILIVLTTSLLGWLMGRWIGFVFISIPSFLIYLYLIYRFAQISIPTSNPREKDFSFLEFVVYPVSRKLVSSSKETMDYWLAFLLIAVQFFTILLFIIFQNSFTLIIYMIARLIIAAIQVTRATRGGEKKGKFIDPDPATEEQWKKFLVYYFYMCGLQYPFWVVKDSASREIDMRISGNYFKDFGGPGVVWTRPHQVVGMSMGIEFNEVDGPGILFSKQYERPISTVDLRTQLRVSEVETVTKNGMPVTLIVFTSFTTDREDWPNDRIPRAEVNRLGQINPLLKGGEKLNKRLGSYPFSTSRTQALLSTVAFDSNSKDGDRNIYWDEWVVKQVEHAARQVVSERSLDELWKPVNDGLNASAANEMADRLRDLLDQKLREVGIRLFGARIVNFKFESDSMIPKQQVATWQTYWVQRVTAEKSIAETQRNQDVEKAHAYAKSMLLDAIGDSMDKAVDPANPKLLPHVVAMYFIHAIENYIRKLPTDAEQQKKLDAIKDFFLYNRTEED